MLEYIIMYLHFGIATNWPVFTKLDINVTALEATVVLYFIISCSH
jgi:hypothetical protein